MVLDLRLTKVGVKRYPFFYILTSSGGRLWGCYFLIPSFDEIAKLGLTCYFRFVINGKEAFRGLIG